jgi:deoxyribonuclease V
MPFHYPARIDFSKDVPPPVADAIVMQNNLRAQVRLTDDFGSLKTIAGIDVGYDLKRELTKAVVAIMDFETLTLQTSVIAYEHTDFPYISGLLAFREVPAILKALDCLSEKPDLLMVDGQGVSHPRRMGIAAHLGVVSGLPAIGVAKSRLTGKFTKLDDRRLSQSPLTDKGENIGFVLRSKEKCNPLFISAGHRISHETALDITLHCLKGYRLPEPTRIADRISKWALAKEEKNPPLLAEDLFGFKEKNV